MDASQLPEGVTLYYTDKAVHLTTNDALMTFLRQKGNGSLPLSRAILAGYEAECGAALQITERSMATELLIHAYLDGVFAAWVRAGETRGRQDGKFYRTARRRAQRGHEPLGLRPAVARLRRAVPPARTQRIGVLLWNH